MHMDDPGPWGWMRQSCLPATPQPCLAAESAPRPRRPPSRPTLFLPRPFTPSPRPPFPQPPLWRSSSRPPPSSCCFLALRWSSQDQPAPPRSMMRPSFRRRNQNVHLTRSAINFWSRPSANVSAFGTGERGRSGKRIPLHRSQARRVRPSSPTTPRLLCLPPCQAPGERPTEEHCQPPMPAPRPTNRWRGVELLLELGLQRALHLLRDTILRWLRVLKYLGLGCFLRH